MHTEKETVRKRCCLFCSRCYSPTIAPPTIPAGCSVAMAKGCAIDILKTRFSVLHRYIAFRFGARFRSVSFWWQDKYPMRDTGCAEGKRMYLTSKNQNASTVRKVLAGLRVRRNEGDGRCGRDCRNLRHLQDIPRQNAH